MIDPAPPCVCVRTQFVYCHSSIQLETGLLSGVSGNTNNIFVLLLWSKIHHILHQWTVGISSALIALPQLWIQIQTFAQLELIYWPVWKQREGLLFLSHLSLLTLSIISLGGIVRFWLQLSSKGGECNYCSRGRGHWGIPSQQSGSSLSFLNLHISSTMFICHPFLHFWRTALYKKREEGIIYDQ